MIYGDPEYLYPVDKTDRVGIRTMVAEMEWDAPRWPMTVAELDAIEPAPPSMPSSMEYIQRLRVHDAEAMKTSWTFMGIEGDPKDVRFKTRLNSHDYKFAPGFSQVDIALHKDLAKLMKKFQGQTTAEGEIFFPALISDGNGGTKTNPMFGETNFLRMEGTYTFRYVSETNTTIGDNEGYIFETKSLPGRPPRYDGRNWLKAPTLWQCLGPVFEIMEQYWLSGPKGWNPNTYPKLNDQGFGDGSIDGSSDAASSLTTGTLTTGNL